MTPTSWATSSPKLLLIANPGTSSSSTQTRSGPIGLLFSSLYGCILPPFDNILFISSSSFGLWSLLKFSLIHIPFLYLPNTALESPVFAHIIRDGDIIVVTHVDPENVVSIWLVVVKSLSIFIKDFVIVCVKDESGDDGVKDSFINVVFKYWGNVDIKYDDTKWPYKPWPSHTPINVDVVFKKFWYIK